MYNQLDKQSTKNLEEQSERIDNIYNNSFSMKYKELLFNKYFKIILWDHHYKFESNKIKDRFLKLSELLGCKPNYYFNYERKTGVWGLEWKGFKFIIYYSLKGMSIQIQNDFPVMMIEKFLDDLINTLIL